MKEVKVTWLDIFFLYEGYKKDVLEEKPPRQTTYGKLLLENDEVVIVASTADDDEDFFRHVVVIPKGAVISVEEVKISGSQNKTES